MKIYINDIPSYRSPESFQVDVDDRQEKIELINGNTVEDYGHIESGDTLSVTALYTQANFNAIKALWEARTLVTFIDEAGITWTNVRIALKSYKYQRRFPGYIMVTFELWRV